MDIGPPPIKRFEEKPFSISYASVAIATVKKALPYMSFASPIIRYGPGGEVGVDIPLVYQGVAIDRVHYDPLSGTPSPKGRPARASGIKVSKDEILNRVSEVIKELRVIEAAEFRDPESAWAVPLAWKSIIVAHVKVTYSGDSIVPDYGLTEELRRQVI